MLASSDPSALQMPDNVFVTRTGHVLIAEDGTPPNAVRVLCPSGRLVTLAQNPGDGEIA